MIRKFGKIYDEVEKLYRETMDIGDKDVLGFEVRQSLFGNTLDIYTTSGRVIYERDDEGEIK